MGMDMQEDSETDIEQGMVVANLRKIVAESFICSPLHLI